MALNVQQSVIAAPTTDGQTSTITLPAGFNPKVILLSGVRRTADGSSGGSVGHFIGFGTYRGGAVQQGHVAIQDLDAAGTTGSGQSVNTDAIGRIFSGQPATTEDMAVTLTSMSETEVVLTWTNAPGIALLCSCLVLGGSDVSDAITGSFALSTAAATQDVALPAGFGQADLLLFLPAHTTTLGNTGATDAQVALGVAKSDTERYCSIIHSDNGHTTNQKQSGQKARAILTFADNTPTPTAFDAEADLADKANWPTDNFRLSYADQADRANQVIYLALKGSFTATIGSADTLTAGSTQDLPHGATPKAMVAFTTLVADTASGIETNTAQLGGFSVGFSDLTNEAAAAAGSDDGQATSVCWQAHSSTKVVYTLDQPTSATAAPVERGQADASASGTDLRLTYTTLDNVARRFGYLILGDGAAAEAPVDLDPASASAMGALALTAPALLGLAAAPAVALASAALTAPTVVDLDPAAAVASGQLTLTVPSEVAVELDPASASVSASLALAAPTEVGLSPAVAGASAALLLAAPTEVPLQGAVATAAATAALTAATSVGLAASAAASASLGLTAPLAVTLDPASAASSAALALSTPTQVPLTPSTPAAAGALSLTVPTRVPLAPAGPGADAALVVSVPVAVQLGPAAAAAGGALAIEVLPYVDLDPAAAAGGGSLSLMSGARPGLVAAEASAIGAPLGLVTPVWPGLGSADSAAGGSLTLSAPAAVELTAAAAGAAGALSLMRPEPVPLDAVSAAAAASLTLVLGGGELPPSPPGHGGAVGSGGLVSGSRGGAVFGPGVGRLERPGGGTIA